MPADPATWSLDERDLPPHPLTAFDGWFKDAGAAGVRLPEAVALATATADGVPSVRMVLLKGYGAEGFAFFSDCESRKGRELAQNPRGALLFYWDPLGRQVRVDGEVSQVAAAESDEYFASRPEASRLSAVASRQSEPIAGRGVLEARVAELRVELASRAIPRPDRWGGYRLVPREYEFWQHREDRLHDRLLYRPDGRGGWHLERLSP